MSENRVFVHDLKNLLGIIIGYSTLLLQETPESAVSHADLNEIRKAGEDALALVQKWYDANP